VSSIQICKREVAKSCKLGEPTDNGILKILAFYGRFFKLKYVGGL
jgi:hypothetical protein